MAQIVCNNQELLGDIQPQMFAQLFRIANKYRPPGLLDFLQTTCMIDGKRHVKNLSNVMKRLQVRMLACRK